MENPIKMDDLGIPLFLETPISTSLKGGSSAKFLFFFHPGSCSEATPFLQKNIFSTCFFLKLT